MREILFKAKRIDNGEWVEGYYSKSPDPMFAFLKDFIFAPYFDEKTECGYDNGYKIDINTLCQYTGLNDKNGNKIWENDIVKDTDIHLLGSVEYDEEHGMYVINEVNDGYQNFQEFWSCTEVIGNIFDNANLLKGE